MFFTLAVSVKASMNILEMEDAIMQMLAKDTWVVVAIPKRPVSMIA